MATRRTVRTVVAATTSALALAGMSVLVAGVGPATAPAAAAGLSAFEDCDAVRDWYLDQQGTPAAGPGSPATELSAQDTAAGARSDGAVGNGDTGSNVQEAGVDEPDVVKIRDGLLFTVQNGTLLIVDAHDDEPRTIGTLTLPDDLQSADLLLSGDRAVLISQPTTFAYPTDSRVQQDAISTTEPVSGAVWAPQSPTTWVGVVDLSDPAVPALLAASETEGYLVDARLTGDTVRVVTSFQPTLAPPPPGPGPSGRSNGADTPDAAAAGDATASPRSVVSGADVLPHLVTRSSGTTERLGPALECAALRHPAEAAGDQVTTIASIVAAEVGPGTDPVTHRVAVAASGSLVYASKDALYVASRSVLPTEDVTEVHDFDTSTRGRTTYRASGTVPGSVIGRWAFSERDGVLRVASTRMHLRAPGAVPDAAGTEPPTDSAVTTMRRDGDTLERLGEVSGLGRGEWIQAVRWFDTTAYVVTFRQVDPLYVVDLTDPAEPTVTGELKIPGFSSYLHPIGDDRLLGVGTAATDEGRVTGLQVSTFDVSDPTAPRLMDSYTRASSSSGVSSDARLFSYLPAARLAVLPASDDRDPNVVVAVRVGTDGTLTVSDRGVVPDDTSHGYLQRITPIGPDRLAALVTDHDPVTGTPSTRLLLLDHSLTDRGSARLG